VVVGCYNDTHTCRLYDSHRYLHRIVETPQVVTVGGSKQVPAAGSDDVPDGSIGHYKRYLLLTVIAHVVSITRHDDG
jgi:hypothetical protein